MSLRLRVLVRNLLSQASAKGGALAREIQQRAANTATDIDKLTAFFLR